MAPIVRLFFATFVALLLPLGLAGCGNSLSVQGNAMAPSIKNGQTVSYDPNAYSSASPKRSDVVVVKWNGALRILRVIGLPGETVSIMGGSVYIDGSQLSEPYLAAGTVTDSPTPSFQVPPSAYFLLTDNRSRDGDSRDALGFVNRSQLLGKVNL